MSDQQDPRAELAGIAADLARHLRWAQGMGEQELPIAQPGSAALAAPLTDPTVPATQPGPRGIVEGARLEKERRPSAALGSTSPPDSRREPRRDSQWDPQQERQPRVKAAPAAMRRSLEEIRADIGDCRRCRLCEGRKQIVFGDGNPQAELVFVGEGPGYEEDQRGLPFVGAAGQLLDRMIEAMGYRREEVYIANVVKCRPPDNRNPEPDEVEACEPFLQAQLASIRPKAIVALGKFAAQTLLREQTPITRLRGRWREYQGIPLMPTLHPAYLLRSPGEKGKAWADLQQVMAALGKRRRR